MKKKFTIILLLFVFNFGYSQFGSSYEEVELTLKNGTIVNGFARINPDDIEFKDLNKKNKKEILFSEINSAKFTVYSGKKKSNKKQFILESLQLEANNDDKSNFVFAEQIIEKEKVRIYGIYGSVGGGFSMGPGLGGQISVVDVGAGFNSNNYVDYYCYLNDDKYPRLMYQYTNFFKTFRIMASECFKDCTELSSKINNKEFTKENIVEIANFYNDKCK